MYVRRLDVNTAKLKLYLVATKRMRYTGLQKFCEIFENTAHLLAVEQLYLRAVVMFEDMITSLSKYAPADLKPTLALCAGICSLCSAVNDPTLVSVLRFVIERWGGVDGLALCLLNHGSKDLTDTKNKLLEYRRRKWLLPEDPELILILVSAWSLISSFNAYQAASDIHRH